MQTFNQEHSTENPTKRRAAGGKRRRKLGIVFPILLMVAAAAGLGLGLLGVGGRLLTPEHLKDRLLFPIVRMLCYLSVGLVVGQLIESMGWTARLARWVRPVTRWGHLKMESGAAFVASFVSGIVANTMLMTFHSEGKLDRREMTLTYLLNNGVPLYLVHLPTTFFIVFSLAQSAGLTYLVITFVAACTRSMGTLILARTLLPVSAAASALDLAVTPDADRKPFTEILQKVRERLIRLVLYSVPIYTLVFLVNHWGLFEWLRKAVAGWVSVEFFPIEAASLVVFTVAAEFTFGFAAAGALLDAGTLTIKQTAVALVVGTIVAAPVRAVRHQLPTHAGIFSLGLATQLLFLSQGLRIVTLLAIVVPYAIWG